MDGQKIFKSACASSQTDRFLDVVDFTDCTGEAEDPHLIDLILVSSCLHMPCVTLSSR